MIDKLSIRKEAISIQPHAFHTVHTSFFFLLTNAILIASIFLSELIIPRIFTLHSSSSLQSQVPSTNFPQQGLIVIILFTRPEVLIPFCL